MKRRVIRQSYTISGFNGSTTKRCMLACQEEVLKMEETTTGSAQMAALVQDLPSRMFKRPFANCMRPHGRENSRLMRSNSLRYHWSIISLYVEAHQLYRLPGFLFFKTSKFIGYRSITSSSYSEIKVELMPFLHFVDRITFVNRLACNVSYAYLRIM